MVKLNVRRIKIILAEREMTMAALSESCGISRQNVSFIIQRGACQPKTAGRLARGLGVPVEEVLAE